MDPKRSVRQGYDKVSYAYRGDDGVAHGLDYLAWVGRLCSCLGSNPSLLDLGCGCGVPVTQRLATVGTVTGIDFSAVQIDRARVLVPNGQFQCDDMCAVRFPVASFDAIVSFYAIIHVPIEEQLPLFGHIADWLRPGGHFMATLGHGRWTGTESNWLGVEGATMYWSHADAQTYRRWLENTGFTILCEEFVPEGHGGHELFHAHRGTLSRSE